MKKLTLLLLLASITSLGQTLCVDGQAGNYDCLGVDLQSRISVTDLGAEELNGIWVNDIWGWVDPETGNEYALVGMTNGTSFVDITDPVNPVVLGILKEHNSQETQQLHDGAKSVWRDIKVYANHAYIVSEDPFHGMQVFDLTQLREVTNPPVDFPESGHYDGIGKAHNLVINEETGFAYAVGFNPNDGRACSGGGLHIINLADPKNPTYAGCFDDDGYTHDAQCVMYQGPDADHQGKEICFNANEEDIVVVDVTDKSSISMISKSTYENARYVHQGWLTEDHRYFLSNDELDEVQLGNNTRTFIWNVEDLDAPVLLGYYEHGTQAIDHNLYTQGKYVYEANYTNGLRILDTLGIHKGELGEVGYFDTFVSSDVTEFDGLWSNYPYFPSGNIVVSDISNGLFILKMQSLYISKQPTDVVACVGAHLDIPLRAVGDDLEYQWQIDDGSGFKDIDDFERYKNTQTTQMHAHTVELSQNGNQYRCVITNGTEEITSEAMTLTVLDSPRAAFTYEITSVKGNISFTNNSASATDYLWEFGDGGHSFLETPVHQFQEDGIYEVKLIASNDCSSDTTIQVVELIIAGFEDYEGLSVYPTVANDNVSIELKDAGFFELMVFSVQGDKLLHQEVQGSQTLISTSGLKPGLYIINIQVGNKVISRKIVVDR